MEVILCAAPDVDPAAGLVFGGDLAIDAARPPRIDGALAGLLAGGALVANVEAPITATSAPAPKAGPTLRMEPQAAAALRELGLSVAGLANNHVGDHGAAGVRDTLDHLAAAGVRTVGAGATLGDARARLSVEHGGTSVALLAVAESEFGMADERTPGAASHADATLPERIRAARDGHDAVVVLAHGGAELVLVPPAQRRDALRALVDAGADLVVGHHPHVAQGWERHGDGAILYSLGDLFMDVGPEPDAASATGLVAQLDLEHRLVRLVAFRRTGRALAPLDADGESARRLRRLADVTAGPLLPAVWQAVAVELFETGYLSFLADVGAPRPPAPSGPPVVRTLRDAARRLRADDPPAAPTAWQALHLGNLLRCESHRWALQTATDVLGGRVEDLRDASTQALLRDLLATGA